MWKPSWKSQAIWTSPCEEEEDDDDDDDDFGHWVLSRCFFVPLGIVQVMKNTQRWIGNSLVPRPSPAPFSWPHTWPLNHPEKREKALYNFYIIKPQGGLDQDVCGLGFSNYGNVPTHINASLWVLPRSPQTNGSGFLVSYCWLLRYRGGPPEASDMDPLVVLLL